MDSEETEERKSHSGHSLNLSLQASELPPLNLNAMKDQSDIETPQKTTDSAESSDCSAESDELFSDESETEELDTRSRRLKEKKAVESMIRRRQVLNKQTGR
jgi:hypothetical protein